MPSDHLKKQSPKKQSQSKCNGCGKFLSASAAVACAACPAFYHRACVGISDSATHSKDWACPDCKRKVRKGDNSSTPVRAVSGCVLPEVPVSRGPSPVPANAAGEIAAITAVNAAAAADGVRELRRELAEYVAEMREFRREMAEHRVLIAGVAARMDGVEQRLEMLEAREAAPPAPSADVAELERTVAQLRLELGDRDQEALLADLEIGQLPEEKGENSVHVVTVLAAKLGVELEERDVVFAERVGAVPAAGRSAGEGAAGEAARDRRLIVRLARRSLRDDLLRAARVRRTLTAADVVGRSVAGAAVPPRSRIFINERLTRANRQLFYRVREECRKNHWRYSWTRRGRIFVRQADGAPLQQIRSAADITRVMTAKI